MNIDRILICGATGFIGRNMLEFFGANEKIKIRATYNVRKPFDTGHLPAQIEWVKADLRNPSDVESVMEGITTVIQAAATTSGSKDIVSSPYIHVTDNAVMNSLLLRSAYHHSVEHFIFFSCTVMYHSSEMALRERDFDPTKALHPRYFGVGHTKIYVEKMLEFFSAISEMKTTAIRHSNIYGPHDKFDFERSHVFGASVSKVMLSDEEVMVWGTGEEERDLLHVDDLCGFVEKALRNQTEKNRLYNCGSGKKISVKELVELIIEKSGKNLRIVNDTSQPTIKTSLFLDCSLAKGELGWTAAIDVGQGISSTLAWWKDNIDPATLRLRD